MEIAGEDSSETVLGRAAVGVKRSEAASQSDAVYGVQTIRPGAVGVGFPCLDRQVCDRCCYGCLGYSLDGFAFLRVTFSTLSPCFITTICSSFRLSPFRQFLHLSIVEIAIPQQLSSSLFDENFVM